MTTPIAGAAASAARAEELGKKVEQARTKSANINRATWGVAVGVMIYGTVNVTMLLIQHHVPWLIAPLLSLMVDLGLIVALLAAPVLADYGRKSGWVNTLRWITALMSWGLNVTEPALKGDWVGVGIHSCGPLLLIVVAEAGAALQRTLADIVGELAAELATAQQAVPQARKALTDLQAEIAGARRELAEMQARAEAETERAETEIAARAEAETLAAQATAQVETLTAQAAAQAEIEAGKQQEIQRRAQEEIGRLQSAVRDAIEARDEARRHAGEQTQAAGLAQGRLTEARDSAERAAAAKAAAEQRAQAHMQQVSAAAEQAEHQLRQQLAAATGAAAAAERRVAELSEQVRTVEAQREEARAAAERAGNRAAIAEQQIADLERGRDAAFDELENVRRRLARATEKAEIAATRQPEISRRPVRKSALPVLTRLPENLPVVESVRPEKVALVLVARVTYPDATLAQLAEITEISDRTVGKVVRAVPADIAPEMVEQILALAGGKVLALTDGRAA
ncbi:hypothetical protein ACQP2Y_46745 (plasmid) [Actinoplanes sp. CA-051413]|uniref:hypothetical protein n=1 Tax=Actinoplanes sp. CA-051413 TaxID=3239899 RepID=UPI003D968506